MSRYTSDDSHDAGQMTSVGSHNGFSYESITASEQSRLHMGNVYHYTNINYYFGLPSVNHNVPPSSSKGLTSPLRSSPPPKLVANFQEVHHSPPTSLSEGFEVRPAEFFRRGRVFITLPRQQAGRTAITPYVFRSDRSTGPYLAGEEGTPRMLKLVVILEDKDFCYALPIRTYGWQGVAKQGVKKSEHAIVYTGSSRSAPRPQPGELPKQGELGGMLPLAIRVDVDRGAYQLNPKARIDFGSKILVHHSFKVSGFGVVSRSSMEALQHQFGAVWGALTTSKNRDLEISYVSRLRVADQNHNVEEDGVDDDYDDDEDEGDSE